MSDPYLLGCVKHVSSMLLWTWLTDHHVHALWTWLAPRPSVLTLTNMANSFLILSLFLLLKFCFVFFQFFLQLQFLICFVFYFSSHSFNLLICYLLFLFSFSPSKSIPIFIGVSKSIIFVLAFFILVLFLFCVSFICLQFSPLILICVNYVFQFSPSTFDFLFFPLAFFSKFL